MQQLETFASIYLNVLSTVLNVRDEARCVKAWGRSVLRYYFTIRGWGQVKNDPHGGNLPDITAELSNAEDKIRELENRAGPTTIPL